MELKPIVMGVYTFKIQGLNRTFYGIETNCCS